MSEKRYHALIRRKGEGDLFQWAVKNADGAFIASGEIDGVNEDLAFDCAMKMIRGVVKDEPATMQFDLRKESERK